MSSVNEDIGNSVTFHKHLLCDLIFFQSNREILGYELPFEQELEIDV